MDIEPRIFKPDESQRVWELLEIRAGNKRGGLWINGHDEHAMEI